MLLLSFWSQPDRAASSYIMATDISGYLDVWARITEQNVPGYLKLQAQGREVEFELDNLQEI